MYQGTHVLVAVSAAIAMLFTDSESVALGFALLITCAVSQPNITNNARI
jgi:hypothetical protein